MKPSAILRSIRPWTFVFAAGLLSAFSFQILNLFAQTPVWWETREVLLPDTQPDDYAAANIGQLKYLATQAAAEMNAQLLGGAGETINALVASWLQPPAEGVTRDDYAAINQGQLKAIAKLFYDRLAAAGYSGVPLRDGQTYPWPEGTSLADNYALVNIGQLKYVFSFSVPSQPGGFVDTDGNGIDDRWELAHFGRIGIDPTADPDGDGLTNLAEYLAGTDPNVAAKSVSPSTLDLIIFSP